MKSSVAFRLIGTFLLFILIHSTTQSQHKLHDSPPVPPRPKQPDVEPLGINEKNVHFVYLVPSDKSVQEVYKVTIENAARHLQKWYADQLGDNRSFTLNSPVVEVYQTTHTTAWYATNGTDLYRFWFNVTSDGFALTGGRFYDTNDIWVFYIDAIEQCGWGGGGGAASVAVLPLNDLRGLAGQPLYSPCTGAASPPGPTCRWVGGMGHELGHALGLPHPPGCEDQQPIPCAYYSIMFWGYTTYPDAYFTDAEKSFLISSPFIKEQTHMVCDFDCSNLLTPQVATTTADVTICYGTTYFAGGAEQSDQGSYADYFQSTAGCDSAVVVTNLYVSEPIYYDTTITICHGDAYLIGGIWHTKPGYFLQYLKTPAGCDSLVSTYLSVFTGDEIHRDVTICEGDRYLAGGDYQTFEGTYYDYYATHRCDSVVITHLFVLPTSENNSSVSICQGDSLWAGGGWQTTTGVYVDSLLNHLGCDSIFTTYLTVLPTYSTTHEVTICQGEGYLAGGSIQTTSGTYYDSLLTISQCDSVIITQLTVDICLAEEVSSTDKEQGVYPVPTTGILHIEYEDIHAVTLYNTAGTQLLQTTVNTIDFKGLPEGNYVVHVSYGNKKQASKRVIYKR